MRDSVRHADATTALDRFEAPPSWKSIRLHRLAQLRSDKGEGFSNASEYVGLEDVESGSGRLVENDAEAPSSERATSATTVSFFREGDVLFGKLRPYLAKVWHATRDGSSTTELIALDPKTKHGRSILDIRDAIAVVHRPRRRLDVRGTDAASRLEGDSERPDSGPTAGRAARHRRRPRPRDGPDRRAPRCQDGLCRAPRREAPNARLGGGSRAGWTQPHRGATRAFPWLGEIPAHWEVERGKWLFTERDDRSETGEEEMLTVSHITGITKRSEKDVNMFEAASTVGYKICQPGDLASTRSGPGWARWAFRRTTESSVRPIMSTRRALVSTARTWMRSFAPGTSSLR